MTLPGDRSNWARFEFRYAVGRARLGGYVLDQVKVIDAPDPTEATVHFLRRVKDEGHELVAYRLYDCRHHNLLGWYTAASEAVPA